MAAALRKAIDATDWDAIHTEGKTRFLVEPSWFASTERCAVLARLCKKYKAARVLEVGACCGLASLTMAKELPDATGEVVALELDPFLAEMGQSVMDNDKNGHKIKYMIGPAMDSLRQIAKDCFEGKIKPFDFLLIDADRAGMMDYFNLFWWESPGMLTDEATVCIDITPFKGQAPIKTRGPSCGDLQGDLWVVPSGQDQIDSLRRTLEASKDHVVYKVAGLLVSHKKDPKADDRSVSRVSTPQFSYAGGLNEGLSHAANPFASFPNDKFKAFGAPRWVAPQPSNPVAELRQAVLNAPWADFYGDGKTMTLVEPNWTGTDARCASLELLITDCKATNVLEIGGFVGITSLTMAIVLPENGRITSVEIDPFLVEFGEAVRKKSTEGAKVTCMVGPASEQLAVLAKRAKDEPDFKPFDFVIIDADRAGVNDYFNTVWKSEGLCSKGATICIDTQPFKGQAPVRLAKQTEGDATQWTLPSGADKVDMLQKTLQGSAQFAVQNLDTLLVVKGTGMADLDL